MGGYVRPDYLWTVTPRRPTARLWTLQVQRSVSQKKIVVEHGLEHSTALDVLAVTVRTLSPTRARTSRRAFDNNTKLTFSKNDSGPFGVPLGVILTCFE